MRHKTNKGTKLATATTARLHNFSITASPNACLLCRCSTCGHYMYKGTKFNTTKEDVAGETYLGIQIFRFYWRCSTCAAEITMKTDPENTDYTVEHGATRNYEPWREKDASKNQLAAER